MRSNGQRHDEYRPCDSCDEYGAVTLFPRGREQAYAQFLCAECVRAVPQNDHQPMDRERSAEPLTTSAAAPDGARGCQQNPGPSQSETGGSTPESIKPPDRSDQEQTR